MVEWDIHIKDIKEHGLEPGAHSCGNRGFYLPACPGVRGSSRFLGMDGFQMKEGLHLPILATLHPW